MEFHMPDGYIIILGSQNGNPVGFLKKDNWQRIMTVTKSQCLELENGAWKDATHRACIGKEDFDSDEDYYISCFVDGLIEGKDDDVVTDHPGITKTFEALIKDSLNGSPINWFFIGKNMTFDGRDLTIDNDKYNYPTTGSGYFNFDVRKFFSDQQTF